MDPKKLRRSKRIPFKKNVRFGSNTPEYFGRTVNFSKTGLQIKSAKIYTPGTPLVIEILEKLTTSKNNNPIKFLGNVVWADSGKNTGCMGIEFLTNCKVIDIEYDYINN